MAIGAPSIFIGYVPCVIIVISLIAILHVTSVESELPQVNEEFDNVISNIKFPTLIGNSTHLWVHMDFECDEEKVKGNYSFQSFKWEFYDKVWRQFASIGELERCP